MRRIAALSLAIAGLLATGAATAQPADGLEVEVREVPDYKAVFGTVESVDQTTARARIAGTVEDLAIDEGSKVEAGEIVAEVVDEKLPLELAALDARIDSLRSELKLAQTEVERARILRERGAVAQSVLDDALTNLEVTQGQRAAAEAERQVVEQRLAEGAVRAPTAGRVLDVHVTAGSVVMPGEVIATIAAERYVLRLHLPERHARFLEVGDTVQVSSRGVAECGEDLREGAIRQVYPRMDDGRVVADVEVGGLGDFFVGERTCVYVATGTRQTIVIPPEYLFRRFGVAYVRVDGVGEVVVQPGQSLPEGVEILAGLRPGDVVLPPPS